MKKIALLIALIFISIHVNAQKKKRIDNKCLVDKMAVVLDMKSKEKEKLAKITKLNSKERQAIKKMVSSSKITKEESRPKMREINRNFFRQLMDLTKRSKKEVVAVVKYSRTECKSNK